MQNVLMAYQVPIPLLYKYRGNFDFALAHLVNFSMAYQEFYRKATSEGRLVLLDNSIHELGSPMPIDAIAEADEAIGGATYIIPPDWHFDAPRTLKAFEVAAERFGVHRLAPVVQGNDLNEFQWSYDWYVAAGCSMVCLPYRFQRRFELSPRETIRHHFLSFHTVSEIEQMRKFPNPTCDTGKPFRFAQHNQELPIYKHHDGSLPKLEMDRNTINLECLETNLKWIKYACEGALPK